MATTGGHLVYSERLGRRILVQGKAKVAKVIAENEALSDGKTECPECGKRLVDLKKHMEAVHGK